MNSLGVNEILEWCSVCMMLLFAWKHILKRKLETYIASCLHIFGHRLYMIGFWNVSMYVYGRTYFIMYFIGLDSNMTFCVQMAERRVQVQVCSAVLGVRELFRNISGCNSRSRQGGMPQNLKSCPAQEGMSCILKLATLHCATFGFKSSTSSSLNFFAFLVRFIFCVDPGVVVNVMRTVPRSVCARPWWDLTCVSFCRRWWHTVTRWASKGTYHR